MFTPVDFKLADLLGIAGATIGIIIAGAILLGGFSADYTGLFDRYRSLTGELRRNEASDPRKGSLRNQIANYRRQIFYTNFAALAVTLALLLFLISVTVASLSVVFPKAMVLRLVGTVSLFAGLLLIAVAVCLKFVALVMSRFAIGKEVLDFSDIPSSEEAFRS